MSSELHDAIERILWLYRNLWLVADDSTFARDEVRKAFLELGKARMEEENREGVR